LEKLSEKLRESTPKEARIVLENLPPKEYAAYLDYVTARCTKAFILESERCQKENGCSLRTQYDTEHP
jgi:hypothetical protein